MKPLLKNQTHSPSWMRFTIRTAILLVAVAALCFASYRVGLVQGRSIGPLVPTNISVSNVYARRYDISDIAKSDDEARLLIEAIYDSVDATNWDIAGGYAELHHDSGSQTLVVSHVLQGHVELIRFLESVREFVRYGGDLVTVLENVANNF